MCQVTPNGENSLAWFPLYRQEAEIELGFGRCSHTDFGVSDVTHIVVILAEHWKFSEDIGVFSKKQKVFSHLSTHEQCSKTSAGEFFKKRHG